MRSAYLPQHPAVAYLFLVRPRMNTPMNLINLKSAVAQLDTWKSIVVARVAGRKHKVTAHGRGAVS